MGRRSPNEEGPQSVVLAGQHLAEDALDLYVLGKMPSEDALATFEEHLLVCEYCQTRLTRVEVFIRATRTAAEALPAANKTNPKAILPFAIAASVLFAVVLPNVLLKDSGPVEVSLTSERNEANSKAPAAKPLILKLDTTGLGAGDFLFELVRANGEVALTGSVQPVLQVKALEAGQYWMRLKQADTGQVLREFSLLVR